MADCPAAQSLCADAYAFAGTIVPGDGGGGGGGGPMANGGHADHPQPPEMEPSAVEPLESPPTVLTPPPTPAEGEEEEEEEVEVEEEEDAAAAVAPISSFFSSVDATGRSACAS